MCSGVLACILATVAAGNPTPPRSAFASSVNSSDDSSPLPSAGLCERPAVEQAPPGILAIIVLAGPLNSSRISFEIWNYSGDPITAVNVDGFDALGGQGLLFNKVTKGHTDDGTSVRIEYPTIGVDGRGPIVLRFDGFRPGQCESVDAEAGTWGDASFHGRVMDAVGARIQVVFERGSRGNGEVVLCGSNGRVFRDIPCHPGDAVALISGSRTMQVRLSQ